MEIVNAYLLKYKEVRKPTIQINKSADRRVPPEVRFDGHLRYQDNMRKNRRLLFARKEQGNDTKDATKDCMIIVSTNVTGTNKRNNYERQNIDN